MELRDNIKRRREMEKNEAIREWVVERILSLCVHNGQKDIKVADIIKEAKELEKYITG